jgi:hypothetical protein
MKTYLRGSLAERLEAKTVRVPFSGCWIFMGHINSDGYGDLQQSGGKRKIKAHRASYEVHRGKIPDAIEVCHTCDVRCCINPSHLFLGTHQDNVDDMTSKLRHPRGEGVGRSKITEQQVAEIRERYARGNVTQQTLAGDYGLHNSVISKIINRKNWRHI